MLGTRLIIRFATAKRWRRALDSEWATGRGLVSSKMLMPVGTHVELRIFVGSTHLDLAAHVQNVLSLPDGEHHLTLSVRWSDSKRLLAETLTHGKNESATVPDEFPPVADCTVSESVPPFMIDRSALGVLPAGPGVSNRQHTPLPPTKDYSADFHDVPETDLNLSVVPPVPGAETDLLPSSDENTSPDVELRGITATLPPASAHAPQRTARSVADHYPDRASRALELLEQAKQAEQRGDLREARRRAALAQAFDPIEPQVQAYLEMLRRRTGG